MKVFIETLNCELIALTKNGKTICFTDSDDAILNWIKKGAEYGYKAACLEL